MRQTAARTGPAYKTELQPSLLGHLDSTGLIGAGDCVTGIFPRRSCVCLCCFAEDETTPEGLICPEASYHVVQAVCRRSAAAGSHQPVRAIAATEQGSVLL